MPARRRGREVILSAGTMVFKEAFAHGAFSLFELKLFATCL